MIGRFEPEYLVWRVDDRAVDWLALREGRYRPLAADGAGVLRSDVFPGLWLDVCALLADDLVRVRSVLEQGIATPEHAQLCARLRPR